MAVSLREGFLCPSLVTWARQFPGLANRQRALNGDPVYIASMLAGSLERAGIIDGSITPHEGDYVAHPTETDLTLLRQAIGLAHQARANGNHPFGAVLASSDGEVMATAENTVVTETDVTGHAETNLVRIAWAQYPESVLTSATLYTSVEPCTMCCGAIYWSGISRVVYGLSEAGLSKITGGDTEDPTMAWAASDVLNAGQRKIEVLGALLADEAAVDHVGFWNPERDRK